MHDRKRIEFLKQQVTLSGLGSATFKCAIAATEKVYTFFEREFQEGQLDPLDVVKDGGLFGPMMEVSNRYLTPQKDVPEMEGVNLVKGVDPRGILEKVVREGYFIHGEENVVEYYASGVTMEGEQRCRIIEFCNSEAQLLTASTAFTRSSQRCFGLETWCRWRCPLSLSLGTERSER